MSLCAPKGTLLDEVRARFSVICLFLFILLFVACKDGGKKLLYQVPDEGSLGVARKVSPGFLASHLQELAGQRIETEGIVWFEFENLSLCPDHNNSRHSVRCFWIEFALSLAPLDSLKHISGHYFVIRGIVDPTSKGHLGAYGGTIKNISYLRQL